VIEDCGRGAGQTKTKEAFVRIERKLGASVAVLGSVLLALSAGAPALAGSGPSAGYARPSGVRFAALANVTNTGFAGWVFVAKAAKSVTTEFKVPTLKCTSTTAGVGALLTTFSGSTSAPKASAAGLLMVCASGTPEAAATVTVNNKETNDRTNGVAPGDLLKATVTLSATKTVATIADLTKGHAFTFTRSGTGAKTSQEQFGDIHVGQGTTIFPIVNFGSIGWTNAAVSGKAIGSVKPQFAVNMQTKAKVLQILTGKITGAKHNAFLTTFKHS
jgi:hypothetical protein